MSKTVKLNKKLFNRLFLKMPTVRKINEEIKNIDNIKFEKSIRYFYYSKEFKIWFAHSESSTKYLYFFGYHDGHITNLNSLKNSIMIDFDKNNNINNHSLGIINHENETVYLNKELLEEKYPNNNFNFKEHIIMGFEKSVKIEIDAFELGKLYGDFFNNLYQLIKKLCNDKKPKSTTSSKTSTMDRFLNAIKDGYTYEQSLKIANIDSSKVKFWYLYGKNGNEKYVEFYNTYHEIMPRDDETYKKMNIIIESLKSGESKDKSLSNANVSSLDFKKWIKKGKNGEIEYLDFYEDYKDITQKNKNKTNNETKLKDQELIQEYITLVDNGDTNKEAFEALNIPETKIKNWKQQGELENPEYIKFYKTYLKAAKDEESKNINQFIELINEGKSNEEAMNIINLPEFKIKQWFNNGKNGDEDYIEFYNAYMKQYEKDIEIEDKIPSHNLKPTIDSVKNENIKTCAICGRSMNAKDQNTICKRCRRKKRCANIAQQMLLSIEPEVPFKKEDLKKLDLTSMQIQDRIWVLQEFNLIKKEKNNKLSLVKKEIIEEFIKEAGVEIIEKPSKELQLTKTCKICGETLEISKFPVSESSADGYEENCKNCKKLITSANYLNEILDYIEFNQEFSEDDLAKYIQDPFLRQAKVWSLLENDLLLRNDNNNKLKLASEEKCNKFLEKYLNKKITTKHETPITPQTEPPILTKKEQMDIVLKARTEGKTRKEAAALAGISTYKITHWYKEGRNSLGEENITFYNQLRKIESELIEKLKKQMNTVINSLKAGNTVNEAIEKTDLTQEELDKWIIRGKNNIKPYKSFLKEYNKYVKSSTEYDDKNNVKAREKFLKYISEGETRKEAAQKASIDLKLIDSWIIQGTKGNKPYDDFYNKYREVRKNTLGKSSSQEEIIKNKFINLLEKGYTLGEASKLIENGKHSINIKKWYVAGKRGVKKHIKFYMKCQTAKNTFEKNKEKMFTLIADGFTIKQACEKLKLDPVKIKQQILKGQKGEKPFDSFYNKILQSKTTLINTKKLFKAPSHPHKSQMIDFLDLLLIGINEKEALVTANIDEVTFKYWLNRGKQQFGTLYIEFTDIYNKIKSGELVKKFKKDFVAEIDRELDEIENINADILDPLPKKLSEELNKLFRETFTGFAWVNKINNLWIYSKRIDKRNVEISDEDIRKLHKKVIKNNLMWGVLDLEKAKQTLKISDENLENDSGNVTADILSPLPVHLKTKFSKGSSTGFAWVSKSGKYYYYTRNNLNIRIKSSNIYDLYHIVLNKKLDWGVIDLSNAKETLKHSKKDNLIINPPKQDILSPLPENIEKKLSRYSKGSSTGFAWVTISGKKFKYERVVNDKKISVAEPTIQELYKRIKVMKLEWGVRDLSKAKKSLNTNLEIDEKSLTNPNTKHEKDEKSLFEPISKKLKPYVNTETGFALVRINEDNWEYNIYNSEEKIVDETILGLYEKVNNRGEIWGVTDIEKAKDSIELDKSKKNNITNNKPEKHENNSILKPLPIEIKKKLKKHSKNNSSGFAWVSKIGYKWQYGKVVNGIPITFRDSDIYKLHEIVLKNNHIWGVRDLAKAKRTLKKCKKELPKPPKIDKMPKKTIQKSFDVPTVQNTDILAPLSHEYEKSFRSSPVNKSGIAWVNKIGNNWIYSRNVDGNQIKIKDIDIYQLHKKVLEKNMPWGIRDYAKAKKIIFNEQPKSDINIDNTQIFVTVNGNIISIEGKIKNNEVIKVLTKIYKFGDNILKMNTNKNDSETNLSIELELNKNQRKEFFDKIKEFNWNISE